MKRTVCLLLGIALAGACASGSVSAPIDSSRSGEQAGGRWTSVEVDGAPIPYFSVPGIRSQERDEELARDARAAFCNRDPSWVCDPARGALKVFIDTQADPTCRLTVTGRKKSKTDPELGSVDEVDSQIS